jgi:hypothetical protein
MNLMALEDAFQVIAPWQLVSSKMVYFMDLQGVLMLKVIQPRSASRRLIGKQDCKLPTNQTSKAMMIQQIFVLRLSTSLITSHQVMALLDMVYPRPPRSSTCTKRLRA